ncbi:hypothetical protein BYT27DRAFT_7099840 [Phlegmacium glaucopus]|nr:hypothetical protein BYT27DRAFT_7099840 [Phlegmacium glaucopus]
MSRQVVVRKKRKCQAITAGPSTSSAEKLNPVVGLRGRRKAGLLASLPSMPLDILFEIFGHLKPYDILRLSRTTKDFRRLLLSKSSLSIWKATLSNVPGLPDCPPGMSEPAWTNLVFSPYCNFCLTTSIRKVQWMFRLRICSRCAKEHLVESRFAFHPFEGNMEYIIPTYPGKKGAKIYLKSDCKLVEDQYAALQKGKAQRLFVEERMKTVLAIAAHAKLCEAWAKDQTLDRDQQLQQLREDRLAAITQKLEDLGWAEDIAGITMPDSLANHKLVDRPQLLTERIWTNIKQGILEFMAEMRDKRLKREFAALVDRRKQSALTVLRTFKNARLPETEIMPQGPDFCHFSVISEVLNQAVNVEVDVSSFNDIIPLLPELVSEWRESTKRKMIQVVKLQNSIRRPCAHKYLFNEIDEYTDETDEYMSDETDEYTDEMDEYMDEDKAPPVGPNLHLTDEELSQKLTLASTVFTCKCGGSYNDYFQPFYDFSDDDDDDDDDDGCWSTRKILFYPQVMGHNCLVRVSKWFPWQFSSTTDPSRLLEHRRSERKQWDSSGLSLHPSAGRTAQHIIRLAGLDPDLATSHEMDQSDVRFRCSACASRVAPERDTDNDNDAIFRLFDWRGAVRKMYTISLYPIPLMPVIQIIHQTNRHPTRTIGSTFVKMSEDDFTADIREAESEHWAKVDNIWSCTHCRDLPKEPKLDTLDSVKKHISTTHQIESPILNEDYFQHFAALDVRNYDQHFCVRYSGGGFSPCKGDPLPLSGLSYLSY